MTEYPDAVVTPEPQPPTKKGRPRWLVPVIAGALGMALGAGVTGVVAEATIGKWSAKVDTVTAERDHFRTSFATATEERDDALATVNGVADREAALETRAEELEDARVELMDIATELEKREKAVGIAEKKEEAKSIYEGVWMVGDDIKPGTYKLREAYTGNMCYWGISQNGRIVDNDIVTGGRPTVTLRKGQEFKNQGCGVWRRL